jgi:hypothetical protein
LILTNGLWPCNNIPFKKRNSNTLFPFCCSHAVLEGF